MRHPTLNRKLRRDIRRQWAQFTALVVTVLLGIALYAASANAYQNLQASYDNAFTQENFADLFVTGGDIPTFSQTARATAGVQAVSERQVVNPPMEADGTKFAGRVISYPAQGSPEVEKLTPLSGASNPSGTNVLLEQHMASDFNLTEGDTFTITGAAGTTEVTVSGVVASAEYLWPSPSRQEPIALPKTFGVVYADPSLTATISGSSAPNESLVLLTDQARADNGDQILAQLTTAANKDGASEVLTRAEQPSNSLLQEDISGFEQMSWAFPILFLAAAGLATYVLLTRRVQEERPIIGMFRAQGMRGRTIAAHYLKFGLAAAVVGAVIGLPLGILGAGALSKQYTQMIQLPDSLVVIEPFRFEVVIIGLAFAVIAGALASWAPAVLATRVTPADAMRGDAPVTGGKLSLIERIIPPLQRAPARIRLIIRSISRHKKRATFTAAGVGMALLLILVSGLMISTMNGLINQQFGQVEKNQGQAIYSVPVTDTQLSELEGVSGVTGAESVIQQPVAVRFDASSYSTSITAFDADTSMHGFVDPDGNSISLPDDGVLVTQSITAQLPSLQVGDQITLQLTEGGESRTVTVSNFVNEALGTFVYSDKEFFATTFGNEIPPMSALLTTTEDADQDTIRADVQKLPGVVSYVQTAALQQLWNQFAGLFYVFVGAMLVLGGLMAFAIIFTTMSVNIVERQRELATLRAAGVRQRTLAGLVGGENLIVATFGVIPGVIAGIIGAKLMLNSYSSDQFTLNLVVSPWIVLIAVVAILFVAALSQWPGLRAIRRMDIAQVVRERAN